MIGPSERFIVCWKRVVFRSLLGAATSFGLLACSSSVPSTKSPTPCQSDTACAAGYACAYEVAQACSATGTCQPLHFSVACSAVAVCGCDGRWSGSGGGCDLPAGYAHEPVASSISFCDGDAGEGGSVPAVFACPNVYDLIGNRDGGGVCCCNSDELATPLCDADGGSPSCPAGFRLHQGEECSIAGGPCSLPFPDAGGHD